MEPSSAGALQEPAERLRRLRGGRDSGSCTRLTLTAKLKSSGGRRPAGEGSAVGAGRMGCSAPRCGTVRRTRRARPARAARRDRTPRLASGGRRSPMCRSTPPPRPPCRGPGTALAPPVRRPPFRVCRAASIGAAATYITRRTPPELARTIARARAVLRPASPRGRAAGLPRDRERRGGGNAEDRCTAHERTSLRGAPRGAAAAPWPGCGFRATLWSGRRYTAAPPDPPDAHESDSPDRVRRAAAVAIAGCGIPTQTTRIVDGPAPVTVRLEPAVPAAGPVRRPHDRRVPSPTASSSSRTTGSTGTGATRDTLRVQLAPRLRRLAAGRALRRPVAGQLLARL